MIWILTNCPPWEGCAGCYKYLAHLTRGSPSTFQCGWTRWSPSPCGLEEVRPHSQPSLNSECYASISFTPLHWQDTWPSQPKELNVRFCAQGASLISNYTPHVMDPLVSPPRKAMIPFHTGRKQLWPDSKDPECLTTREGNCEYGRRYRKWLEEEGSAPYKLNTAPSPGPRNLWSFEITGSNHFTIHAIKQASTGLPERPALACTRPCTQPPAL